MFRHVHPFAIRDQWAERVRERYQLKLETGELIAERSKAFSVTRDALGEVDYTLSMKYLYDSLKLGDTVTEESFCDYCRDLEMALEIGAQYPNTGLIKSLTERKREGSLIYIVSDFHLGKAEFIKFLKAHDVDTGIFDEIVVSCDHGKTKQSGELYDYVIGTWGIDPDTVEMFGDSVGSDHESAKRHGIKKTHLRRRLLHKAVLKGRRIAKCDYGRRMPSVTVGYCKKSALPFAEYLQLYYSFVQRLSARCAEENVYFLSREGLFLKKLFDQYEYLLGGGRHTDYFLCSRESAENAREKEREAFCRYADGKGLRDGDALVDIGWKGTMQKAIEDILGIRLKGYYLGLNGDPGNEYGIDKTGLVFHENMGSEYHVLKSNTQLYEQLAAAPHGSPRHYVENNGTVGVSLEWPEEEKFLYEKEIGRMQEELLLLSAGMAAWNGRREAFSNKDNCLTVLRSGLFADKERIAFLKLLDNTFVYNFGNTAVGTEYQTSSVKIGPDIFYAPEQYCRYFVKLQRMLSDRPILNGLYYLVAGSYYAYVRIVLRIKCRNWRRAVRG